MQKRIGTKLLFTVLAVVMGCSLPARADVIYDGGASSNGGDGDALACTGFEPNCYIYSAVAASFVLSAGASTVTGADWWGVCGIGACPATEDFTLSIYTDSSGLPGTLVDSYDVGSADQTATGYLVSNVSDEYEYSASFGPLDLNPGQTYWLGISDAVTTEQWAWAVIEASPIDEYPNPVTDVGGVWQVDDNRGIPQHPAFMVLGTTNSDATPEPASWLLLATGLAGLTAGRGMRRIGCHGSSPKA